MKVYVTNPENITDVITNQISKTEEGTLLTDYSYNVFLPNYTTRISEFLDATEQFNAKIDKLIDILSNGFLPAVAVGSPPYTPTFPTDLATLKTELTELKQKFKDIKEKL